MSIWDKFAKISASQKKTSKPEFIIAGLGNPGTDYENTRHNAGFIAIDRLCEKNNIQINRHKFSSIYGEGEIGGKNCLILKPQTYMNNSGEAIAAAAQFYKIEPENILVLFDDISLDVGKLRIRRKGSHGGHNGAKSIVALLDSEDFIRIKIGVGKKPRKDYDLAKWVLSKFTDDERKLLEQSAEKSAQAAELIAGGEIDKAMNLFNS